MLPLRVWVHCPRASNGLLPPRSDLVGYMRWYAWSDSGFIPPSNNHSNSFQFAGRLTLPWDYFTLACDPPAIGGNRQWIAIPLLLPAEKFQFGTYESPRVPRLTFYHVPEQANCVGAVVMIETPVPDAIAHCVEA